MDDFEIEDSDDGGYELPKVAASEHDILVMARVLIAGPAAQDDVWSLLCAGRVMPPKIGTTCAELLEETLRMAWLALAQRGGWRPRASVGRSGNTARGRVWDRYQAIPLEFSSATLSLLRWLVAQSFAAPPSTIATLPAAPLTIGDQVMVYLALDATRVTPAARVIASQPFVHASALAWLGFAPLLAGKGPPPANFDSLTDGAGAVVVEALSDELARRWYAAELPKRQIEDPQELITLGGAQDTVMTAFMDSCDKRKRRDLAGFVLDAVVPVIARSVPPAPAQLDPRSPLSVRAQARNAAGSLLRGAMRWYDWDQQHRGVRYIDDDYAAAQLLLQQFERIGAAGVAKLGGWLTDLASLAPTTPATPEAIAADEREAEDASVELLSAYVASWQQVDYVRLASLLEPNAVLATRPQVTPNQQGPSAIIKLLESSILFGMRPGDVRLIPTTVDGAPAFAMYVRRKQQIDDFGRHSVHLLKFRRGRIVLIILASEPALFDRLGLATSM
jgi:FtsH ternary system-associated peptide